MKSNKYSLILVLVSILAGVIGFEYFLRLVYSDPDVGQSQVKLCKDDEGYFEKECYGTYDTYALMTFYSKAGYRPTENWKGAGIRINDFGARSDRNLADLRSKDVILYTGGSTAFGSGVKQQDLFTEAANSQDKRFAHVTAGVGGYIFSNELAYFNDYLRFSKPRVWVSFGGWNDVYAYYRGNDYYRSPDMLNITGIIAKANYDYRYNKYIPARNSAEYYFSPQSYRFKTLFVLRRALDKLQNRTESDLEPYADSKWIPKGYDDLWDQYRLNLIIADKIAHEMNIEFVVAIQPSLYNTRKSLSAKEERMLESYRKKFPDLEAHFKLFFPKLISDIQSFCEANHIRFLNLDEAIRSERETLFVDHVHFGSKGHKLIGAFFSKQLSR